MTQPAREIRLESAESRNPASTQTPPVPRAGRPTSDPASTLRDLLADRTGERHIIAIQDFPDPDAISSALAYQEIAKVFGIEAEIVFEGLISHPENLALVNLLEIPL